MNRYEILIPSSEPDGFDMTVRVDAISWMAALKQGITKLELSIDVKRIVVDLRDDDSVLVTEPGSGRTFEIRPAKTAQVDVAPPKVEAAPRVQAPPPKVEAAPRVQAPPPKVEAAPRVQAPPPKVEAAPRVQAPPPKVEAAPRVEAPPPPVARDRTQEQRLVRAFHKAGAIASQVQTPAEAAEAFLDAALELVPAEAGAVLFADISQQDMFIAFARGKNTNSVLNTRIPFGAGVSGHAVLYGIGLAVNEVARDFRFDPKVNEALGTVPKAMLSSPAHKAGRTYGALHLVNRENGARFSDGELEVVGYLASHFAEFLETYFLRVA